MRMARKQTVTKYYKKYNRKALKWQILNITGLGNSYKVKVKVTRPNLYKTSYKAFYQSLKYYWNHPDMSVDTVGEKDKSNLTYHSGKDTA